MKNDKDSFVGLIDRSNLQANLSDYKRVNDKISYMMKKGDLIQVMRGKYVSAKEIQKSGISLFQVSNALYGPSYITSYTALSYYGLIPESVHTIIAVTTNRSRTINSKLGLFEYTKVIEGSFSIGIDYIESENISFLLASPTKSLIDLLWTMKHIQIYSTKSLHHFLESNLRFEMESLKLFNKEEVEKCIKYGRKKRIIKYLLNIINQSQNEFT